MDSKRTTYHEDFKKKLVSLYTSGVTRTQLCREFEVPSSTLGKWIHEYSTIQLDGGEVLTAKEVKELLRRNTKLEEEVAILKKAIAIFTPHSIIG